LRVRAGQRTSDLVFQALRDEITKRGEEILSLVERVVDGACVEAVANLAKSLKADLLRRLESIRDIAFTELRNTFARQIQPYRRARDVSSLA